MSSCNPPHPYVAWPFDKNFSAWLKSQANLEFPTAFFLFLQKTAATTSGTDDPDNEIEIQALLYNSFRSIASAPAQSLTRTQQNERYVEIGSGVPLGQIHTAKADRDENGPAAENKRKSHQAFSEALNEAAQRRVLEQIPERAEQPGVLDAISEVASAARGPTEPDASFSWKQVASGYRHPCMHIEVKISDPVDLAKQHRRGFAQIGSYLLASNLACECSHLGMLIVQGHLQRSFLRKAGAGGNRLYCEISPEVTPIRQHTIEVGRPLPPVTDLGFWGAKALGSAMEIAALESVSCGDTQSSLHRFHAAVVLASIVVAMLCTAGNCPPDSEVAEKVAQQISQDITCETLAVPGNTEMLKIFNMSTETGERASGKLTTKRIKRALEGPLPPVTKRRRDRDEDDETGHHPDADKGPGRSKPMAGRAQGGRTTQSDATGKGKGKAAGQSSASASATASTAMSRSISADPPHWSPREMARSQFNLGYRDLPLAPVYSTHRRRMEARSASQPVAHAYAPPYSNVMGRKRSAFSPVSDITNRYRGATTRYQPDDVDMERPAKPRHTSPLSVDMVEEGRCQSQVHGAEQGSSNQSFDREAIESGFQAIGAYQNVFPCCAFSAGLTSCSAEPPEADFEWPDVLTSVNQPPQSAHSPQPQADRPRLDLHDFDGDLRALCQAAKIEKEDVDWEGLLPKLCAIEKVQITWVSKEEMDRLQVEYVVELAYCTGCHHHIDDLQQ